MAKQWVDWSKEEATLKKTQVSNRHPQPTNEEFAAAIKRAMPHLALNEEELKKTEGQDDWNKRLEAFFNEVRKPVGEKFEPAKFKGRSSFNSTLTPEQLKERNAFTKDE